MTHGQWPSLCRCPTRYQSFCLVSFGVVTLWIVPEEPRFNPDKIDGRHIFGVATQRFTQSQSGDTPAVDRFPLSGIATVDSVLEARERGDVCVRSPA